MSSTNKIGISVVSNDGYTLLSFPSAESMFNSSMLAYGNFFGLDLGHLLSEGELGFRVTIGCKFGERTFQETIYKDAPNVDDENAELKIALEDLVAKNNKLEHEYEDLAAKNNKLIYEHEELRCYLGTYSNLNEENKKLRLAVDELTKCNEDQRKTIKHILELKDANKGSVVCKHDSILRGHKEGMQCLVCNSIIYKWGE